MIEILVCKIAGMVIRHRGTITYGARAAGRIEIDWLSHRQLFFLPEATDRGLETTLTALRAWRQVTADENNPFDTTRHQDREKEEEEEEEPPARRRRRPIP